MLQNNLTTGERLFQVINPSGQLIYEKSLIPTATYNAGNNSLVLYDKSKFLPVPVATNGTLVTQPLTTGGALTTVPLLTDGANKVSQVQSILIPKANVNNMDLLKAFKRVEDKKIITIQN
ncbi:hypothetical protein [Fusobacterium canifelinum]|uniref:hypothetical protein n=1 Tax=Fusobacterium canifelinum TaxID=285729 RepID=UPI001F366AD7|nr:hypothetical protein [Fusobacterium canifelinum]